MVLLIRYKTNLVTKSYAQKERTDFEETFAPTSCITTIRCVIALAAHNGWEVHQLDMKRAFLNGILEEEVNVSQPPRFEVEGSERDVPFYM